MNGNANNMLNTERFRTYVEEFNTADPGGLSHAVSNEDAWDFLCGNVPFFECPDKELEKTYYFRWWTFRKHIKETPEGFVVTEFLPQVEWSQAYNTINCALGHHLYEGRWLRDPRFLNDDVTFFLRGSGDPAGRSKHYTPWLADAVHARFLVSGDQAFITDLLPDLASNHEDWGRDGEPGNDWQKSRRVENGLYWQIDSWEGTEYSIGGTGCRPSINSAMFGDKMAISRIAEMAGRTEMAETCKADALRLRQLVQEHLWDAEAGFFKVLKYPGVPIHQYKNHRMVECEPGKLVNVREIFGYVPWYFNLPEPGRGFEEAWRFLGDETCFKADFGPTTAEQSHPNFQVYPKGCTWCGSSWPYATSQTLTAMANVLHQYPQEVISKKDYLDLLQTYSRTHRRTLPDGTAIPWVDESLNPFTGEWILNGKNGERGRDYNHSTFCDLIISGLVGLRPRADDRIELAPLVPEGEWEYFCLDRVSYHGHDLAVFWDRTGEQYGRGPGLHLVSDGRELARQDRLSPITCRL